MDPFFFQHFSRLDALPGGRDLDQNAVIADASVVIQTNELATLLDRGVGVVAQACIDFGGHPAGDNLEDFLTENHTDFIQGFMHHVLNRSGITDELAGGAQRLINQTLISRDLCSCQDQ